MMGQRPSVTRSPDREVFRRPASRLLADICAPCGAACEQPPAWWRFGIAANIPAQAGRGLHNARAAGRARRRRSPEHLRATAFGVLNFASGVALLLASLIAGFLWDQIGPSATFVAGAAFTAFGLLTLFITRHANPVK